MDESVEPPSQSLQWPAALTQFRFHSCDTASFMERYTLLSRERGGDSTLLIATSKVASLQVLVVLSMV